LTIFNFQFLWFARSIWHRTCTWAEHPCPLSHVTLEAGFAAKRLEPGRELAAKPPQKQGTIVGNLPLKPMVRMIHLCAAEQAPRPAINVGIGNNRHQSPLKNSFQLLVASGQS
jgi:hypothetical protein